MIEEAILIEQLLSLPNGAIKIADIGAAYLGETEPYQPLLANGLGQLFAFEPDARQVEKLRQHLGAKGRIIQEAAGDGREHTLHICNFGWTSLLEPDPAALAFFNTFPVLGRVESTVSVKTRRLDDIDELPKIDFLKMDIQGSELMVLQNARQKLSDCVAVDLEISFITLYKDQPSFGHLDLELRSQGFIPHRFTNIKGWSITPTIRNNTPQLPFNQLLEADIVYIKDIIHLDNLSDLQIMKLAAIAHFVYNSPDLVARCILDLQKRNLAAEKSVEAYLQTVR
jgi:FkbM family methyltransferase